jgi:hypothetical protein
MCTYSTWMARRLIAISDACILLEGFGPFEKGFDFELMTAVGYDPRYKLNRSRLHNPHETSTRRTQLTYASSLRDCAFAQRS